MFRRLIVFLGVFAIVIGVGWLAMRRADISYAGLERFYGNNVSRFADLEGGEKIHFRDMGPRDAPVVVLVHGFASSMQAWDEIVPELKAEYRVITLDLPAHGLSRCYVDEAVDIPRLVQTIDTLTTGLDAETFTLIGHGLGGNIAWNFAVEHPERLDGMVLIDATGWKKSKEEFEQTPFIVRAVQNEFARPVLKGLDFSPLFQAALEKSFSDQSFVTDELIERHATLSRAPCHREALLAMMGDVKRRDMADTATLSNIAAPVLVLHGADDQIVPVAHAAKFAEAISDATVSIYENVGHLSHQEAPARVLEDIQAFLGATYSTRTHTLAETVSGTDAGTQ